MKIAKSDLEMSKPDDIIRLAGWLKIKTTNLTIDQVIKLIRLRLRKK